MWSKSHSVTVTGIEPEQIWKIWSDIKMRTLWDDDTEWAEINGPFEIGSIISFKTKGGPKLKLKITECTPNQSFTDTFQFPFARMDGIHTMEKTPDGLRLTTTMQITGPLAWLWRKLVVEKIVATLPHQTNLLIQMARKIPYNQP